MGHGTRHTHVSDWTHWHTQKATETEAGPGRPGPWSLEPGAWPDGWEHHSDWERSSFEQVCRNGKCVSTPLGCVSFWPHSFRLGVGSRSVLGWLLAFTLPTGTVAASSVQTLADGTAELASVTSRCVAPHISCILYVRHQGPRLHSPAATAGQGSSPAGENCTFHLPQQCVCV
jgi:hypothetical protein